MRRAEVIAAAVLLVGGLVLVREAVRLTITWTSSGPGTGFFPFALAVLVAVQAAIILIRQLRVPVPPGRAAAFVEREAFAPLLIVFLPMVAVIALIRYLGIYIGGALYLAGYMTFVGRHNWVTTILVSVLVPLTLFFIFERWFLLPLPKGLLLEFLLYGR